MAPLETRTVALGWPVAKSLSRRQACVAAIVEHLERCGYRIVKCDEDRGQKPPRRVRHRVTRFPLGIASREAPSPWTCPEANRSKRQAGLLSEPADKCQARGGPRVQGRQCAGRQAQCWSRAGHMYAAKAERDGEPLPEHEGNSFPDFGYASAEAAPQDPTAAPKRT